MSHIKKSGSSTMRWFLTLAGVALVAGLVPALAEAQDSGRSRQSRASVTRSGQGQRSARSQQGRAPSQRTTVNRGSSSHRSRGRGDRHHGGSRRHYSGSRLHLGFGSYYLYGWPYYNPYYYGSYYGPYRYGHYPYEYGARYRRAYAEPLGAFDLNVKPKKTEVYLNGHPIGTAGKYDGYPGVLWLPQGEHQLVFYKPGFVTEVRVVEALPGVEIDLELDMQPGETTPVKELAVEREQIASVERRSYVGPRSERAPAPAARAPASAARMPASVEDSAGETEVLDTRDEPGRLSLRVAPADAAVYLDGRFLGTGGELAGLHAGLLVDAGDHVLDIVRPGREVF